MLLLVVKGYLPKSIRSISMKKFICFFAALAILSSVSFSAITNPTSNSGTNSPKAVKPKKKKPVAVKTVEKKPTPPPQGHGYIQLQGGEIFPASSDAVSHLNAGSCGEIQAGYSFPGNFSLGLEYGIGNFSFKNMSSGYSATLSHSPLEIVAQTNFPIGAGFYPFVLLGAGIAMDSLSMTPAPPASAVTGWTNMELDPGIGLGFELAGGMDLFLQMKMAMDFETTAESNASKGKLYSDNPIILFPVQGGVNFKL